MFRRNRIESIPRQITTMLIAQKPRKQTIEAR